MDGYLVELECIRQEVNLWEFLLAKETVSSFF